MNGDAGKFRPGDVVEDQLCVGKTDLGEPVFRPLRDVVEAIRNRQMSVPLTSNLHPSIREAIADSRRGVWADGVGQPGSQKGFRPARTGKRGQ